MKTTYYRTLSVAFTCCLLFLSSCYLPKPVSRLTSLAEDTKWEFGNQVVHLDENQGFAVHISYLKSTPDAFIFDITIMNKSDDTVLVNPRSFQYQPLGPNSLTQVATTKLAIDPERKLLELDLQESREIADARNSSTAELVSMTTNTVSDVSNIGKDRPQEERDAEQAERDQRRADYETEEFQREYRLTSLNDTRKYWEEVTLRKTTLEPGYEVRGTVFFPRCDKASFLKFNFKVGNRDFQTLFQQQLVGP